MKFILMLLSMMFVFSVSAISVDNDVGAIDALRVVYVVPNNEVSQEPVITELPTWLYTTEAPDQLLNKDWRTDDGVDVGSINRFVILNSYETNFNHKRYRGYSFDCVNKLI